MGVERRTDVYAKLSAVGKGLLWAGQDTSYVIWWGYPGPGRILLVPTICQDDILG